MFSHYWPHGEIPEWFPSSPAIKLGNTPVSFVMAGWIDTSSKV
jgi:hypothetical protein